MANDRITYSLGYTINLGNYENAKIDVSYSADVGDDDDTRKMFKKITAWVEHQADNKVIEIYHKAKPWVDRKSIRRRDE